VQGVSDSPTVAPIVLGGFLFCGLCVSLSVVVFLVGVLRLWLFRNVICVLIVGVVF